MKRFFLLLSILLCSLPVCWGQFSVTTGSYTTNAASLTISVTVGQIVILTTAFSNPVPADLIVTSALGNICNVGTQSDEVAAHPLQGAIIWCAIEHAGSDTFSMPSAGFNLFRYDILSGGSTYWAADNSPTSLSGGTTVTLGNLFAPSVAGLQYCAGLNTSSSTDTIGMPAGYTAFTSQGASAPGLNMTLNAGYRLTSTSGTTTPTITFLSGSNNKAMCVAFRTSVPFTVGVLGWTGYYLNNNLKLPQVPVGATVLTLSQFSGCSSTAVSDSNSNAYLPTPIKTWGDVQGLYFGQYAINNLTSDVTITPGSTGCGIMALVMLGTPYFGESSTMFSEDSAYIAMFSNQIALSAGGIVLGFANSICSNSNQGNLSLPSGYEGIADFIDNGTNGGGRENILFWQSASAGTYSTTVNSCATTGGGENNLIMAWLPSIPNYPILRQKGNGGCCSFSLNNVVANNFAVITMPAFTSGTASDSCGDTFTQYPMQSNSFSTWQGKITCGGTVSFTVPTISSVFGVNEFQIPSGATFTQTSTNSLFNASLQNPVPTGSITTVSTQWLLSCVANSSGSARLNMNFSDTGWRQISVMASSHSNASNCAWMPNAAAGTYQNHFNFPTTISPSAGQIFAFSFTVPPVSGSYLPTGNYVSPGVRIQ